MAVSALLLILSYTTLRGPIGFVLLWICIVPFIIAIGNLLKNALKKRGISRNVNRIASVCVVLLLTFLMLGLMTTTIIQGRVHFNSGKNVIGTYELYGRTREIYDDPLPLEIEELADVDAQWSKEADHQETFLLSSTEYRQYSVLTDGSDNIDERRLEYTVTEVKQDFLYDFTKKSVLNSRQDEIHDDFVFTDHYEPIDAAIWNADEAYQLHWSDSVLNTYLIFWGNRVVEIKFYWEPTPEQIAIAAEKLRVLL